MKYRVLIILILTAALFGATHAAEPEKVYWYEVVVEVENSVERFVGTSEGKVGEFEQWLSQEGYVTLENLRALENRGDGHRWYSVREGEQVKVRSSRVLYFYVLQKDPRS
jgi:hypothetical protein